jgi:hypothetical protein
LALGFLFAADAKCAWRISSARVIAIPLVSNSHQIFYDMMSAFDSYQAVK